MVEIAILVLGAAIIVIAGLIGFAAGLHPVAAIALGFVIALPPMLGLLRLADWTRRTHQPAFARSARAQREDVRAHQRARPLKESERQLIHGMIWGGVGVTTVAWALIELHFDLSLPWWAYLIMAVAFTGLWTTTGIQMKAYERIADGALDPRSEPAEGRHQQPPQQGVRKGHTKETRDNG